MATGLATKLILGTDANGKVTYGTQFAAKKKKVLLSANTLASLVVPSGVTEILVTPEPGSKVWVSLNDNTVTPPTTGTFTDTPGEMNPILRYGVQAGDTIYFITSDTTAEVGVIFYA